jgi:hypothetical protein
MIKADTWSQTDADEQGIERKLQTTPKFGVIKHPSIIIVRLAGGCQTAAAHVIPWLM